VESNNFPSRPGMGTTGDSQEAEVLDGSSGRFRSRSQMVFKHCALDSIGEAHTDLSVRAGTNPQPTIRDTVRSHVSDEGWHGYSPSLLWSQTNSFSAQEEDRRRFATRWKGQGIEREAALPSTQRHGVARPAPAKPARHQKSELARAKMVQHNPSVTRAKAS
jgi:hypothetical protein